MTDRTQAMLTEPPLRLLLQMTAPNTLAFTLQACVNLAEIYMIGRLGTEALAAIALVFPLLILVQTMSGGPLGGAITASIARALGNGNCDNAERLVWHAIYGAFIGAAVFFVLFALFGRQLLVLLGGDGIILDMAMSYCWVLFSAGLILWLGSTLGAAYRGAGDMAFPAKLMIFSAMLQVPLTAILVFGLFGVPALGVTGAAASSVFVGAIMISVLLVELLRGHRAISLRMHQRGWRRELATDILKVARPASLNPLMNVATILGLTALVGQFGTQALAGYGIGTRIEFVMLPVIFAFGTALTTIVGTNVGAGNYDRAELAGRYGMTSAALICGTVGGLLALFPNLWIPIFTDDAGTFEVARNYIRIVGPAYAFLGIGLVLYFASQGAGTMRWPIRAQILRFVLSVGGAFFLVNYLGYGLNAVFIVTVVALVLYAGIISAAVFNGAWRPKSSG
ncbi:MAG: putative FMN/FAD exporter YeeO [Alphaproteobacteria bacterium]|nr:MAG: putative FMN/FAD exporter YeeO [Alphaproteobacteria bacterium]